MMIVDIHPLYTSDPFSIVPPPLRSAIKSTLSPHSIPPLLTGDDEGVVPNEMDAEADAVSDVEAVADRVDDADAVELDVELEVDDAVALEVSDGVGG